MPKHDEAENWRTELSSLTAAHYSEPCFTVQALCSLSEQWCLDDRESITYMALTLEEIGVEKYLPGAAEVLSGTLSLLRKSLPPCSNRHCIRPASSGESLARILALMFALCHAGRANMCENLIISLWPRSISSELSKKVNLLARAFSYANLPIPMTDEEWNLLGQFQVHFYKVKSTIH